MKFSIARGFKMTLQAIPDVFRLNPHGASRKIESRPFESRATAATAWEKTGTELAFAVKKFGKNYGRLSKATR